MVNQKKWVGMGVLLLVLILSGCDIKSSLRTAADTVERVEEWLNSPADSNSVQENQTRVQSSTAVSNALPLTYYVKGNAKTVNAVFAGVIQTAYYLDNGGNIAYQTLYQDPDGKWGDWNDRGILWKRIQGIDSISALGGYINGVSDFYSAEEETDKGERYILLYQKHNKSGVGAMWSEFYWEDERFVYTLQKIYIQQK